MSDRGADGLPLRTAWTALSHRLAVAAGSFVALVALFHHVPILQTSLRGLAAWAAVRLVAKLGLLALEGSERHERTHPPAGTSKRPEQGTRTRKGAARP
jgi:hypothetical protein